MVGAWFTSHWVALVALLFLLCAAPGSRAADARTPLSAPAGAIVVFTKAPAAATAGPIAALQAKSRERGRLRVIAGLRLVMRSEQALSAEEAEQQRRALKEIETAVLGRVLADAPRAGAEPYAFQTVPYVALFVDAAQLARLLADPQVVSVEHHEPLPPVDDQIGPPSPLVAAGSQDSVAAVQAPEVWAKGYGGEYTVAVLDAGVASGRGRDKQGNRVPAHPMLAGKIVSEACFSNAGRVGESLCPDAGALGPKGEDGAAAPCEASLALCWRGTHVASLVAGNAGARFGVARGANVIAVQIFTRFGAGSACGDRRAPCIAANPEDLAKALERVLALRKAFPRLAAVAVGAAGGRYAGACDADFPLLATLTAELRRSGVAMVAPAGNRNLDGFIAAPACLSKAVAVGDASPDGRGPAPDRGSNTAAFLALMAPGASVVAAHPPALYAEATGTGVAAAHVAGGFALLRQVKPTAGVDELLAAMACTDNAVERSGVVKPRLSLLDAYRYLIRAKGGARAWSFARPSDAEDWTPISGAWAIQAGSYVGTPAPGDSSLMAALANCHSSSWDLSVSMLRADPERTNYPAGLVVQASMDSDKWLKGYFLTFSPSGDANIWRLDGRTRTFLCPERGKFSVAANDYNTLRVVRNGSLLTYYLNGGLVCSVRDGAYASGAVVVSAPLPERSRSGFVAVRSVELKPAGLAAEASDALIDPERPARDLIAGAARAQPAPKPR